ncbi:MAG: hypothetical protein ABIJ34_03375 [archaeon]
MTDLMPSIGYYLLESEGLSQEEILSKLHERTFEPIQWGVVQRYDIGEFASYIPELNAFGYCVPANALQTLEARTDAVANAIKILFPNAKLKYVGRVNESLMSNGAKPEIYPTSLDERVTSRLTVLNS